MKFQIMEERFNNMQSMLEKLIAGLSKTADQQQANTIAQSLFSSGMLKPATQRQVEVEDHLSMI